MLEPTTLPTAIAGAPSNAACSDTSNSGMEVPKPTTVSARFEAGLKKGAFVTLYGGTVGAVWAKEGAKTPLVVFGVALR